MRNRLPVRSPLVYVPRDLFESDYTGDLYGCIHENTGVYNIIAWGDDPSAPVHTQAGDLMGQNRNASPQMAKSHTFAVTGPGRECPGRGGR